MGEIAAERSPGPGGGRSRRLRPLGVGLYVDHFKGLVAIKSGSTTSRPPVESARGRRVPEAIAHLQADICPPPGEIRSCAEFGQKGRLVGKEVIAKVTLDSERGYLKTAGPWIPASTTPPRTA